VIAIYKRLGETPLEALEKLRNVLPEYAHATLSYAGRLDPMAEGILLVMVGEENNDREKYLGLDKEYQAEMLFGIETDTYDILGKITKISEQNYEITQEKIKTALKKFEGEHELPYPPFSSRTVAGKPLFAWAREGKLNEIEIPTRNITVFETNVDHISEISSENLLKTIQEKISLVKGDFRQPEILQLWQENLKKNGSWTIAKISISCSSGTYIRSLIHMLGKELKMPTTTCSIKRTKIGQYTLENTLELSP
jgi:tRNA pseudouridine55 synthase